MTGRGVLPVHMAEEELTQLLGILDAAAPRRCLEWGSGGSTRALLAAGPYIQRYVSIEHQALWYHRVRAIVQDPRLELYLRPPDPAFPYPSRWWGRRRAWDARAEREPVMLADYVAFPGTLNTRFDFVLVDGRARRFCLRAGWELLGPSGILVLHDAQRLEYHDVLFSLAAPECLEPWKRGQLAVLRKDGGGVSA